MNLRVAFPLILVSLLFNLAGCNVIPKATPDPTKFYVLHEVHSPSAATDDMGLTIGLLPLELPIYLENARSIAVASPGNRIAFRDFDRWAESLDDGITRVLRSALQHSAGIGRVKVAPFSVNTPRDFDLSVRIINCEGFETGDSSYIRFALAYEITSADEEFVLLGTYQAPPSSWDGSSGELASLLSQAIGSAAAAITADLP